MNKRLFGIIAPFVFVLPLASCNNQNQDFSMNDDVCTKYLAAQTSKEQFNIIYNNISSTTGAGHDVAVPYNLSCKDDGSDEYYFHISNKSDFTDEWIKTESAPELALYDLIPGKEYYWKITSNKTSDPLNSGHFKVNKDNVRWINVPSVGNFRDLGGWDLPNGKQIKFGQLYRGRNPNSISNEDKDVLINKLCIKTQIDLRKDDDSSIRDVGPKPFDNSISYYYYNEMLAYDDVIERIKEPLRGPFVIIDSEKVYPADVDPNKEYFTGADMFKNIFEVLADESNYPVYFHCSAGADRTGSLAFLIEGLLGVSEEDMTRDYELTTFCTNVKGGRIRREPNASETDFDYTKPYFFVYDNNPPSVTHWPLLIDEMKVYGSNLPEAIANFLKNKCGVSQDTIDKVKANLTE